MITLTALLIVALVIAIVALVFGTGIAFVFGDLIVCGLFIWLLVKLFKRKKK